VEQLVALVPALAHNESYAPGFGVVTRGEALWAMSMVKSRSYEGFAIAGHRSQGCLVPMADMSNHAQRGGATLRSKHNPDGSVSLGLWAVDQIRAGDEVHRSDHVDDMGRQLQGFGFCTADAEPLLGGNLLVLEEDDALGAAKLRIFEDAGCDDTELELEALKRGESVHDKVTLPCARIMVLTPELVEAVTAELREDATKDELLAAVTLKLRQPFSSSHEAAAMEYLRSVHQSFIDRDQAWRARVSRRSEETSIAIEALLYVRDAQLRYHKQSTIRLADAISVLEQDVQDTDTNEHSFEDASIDEL